MEAYLIDEEKFINTYELKIVKHIDVPVQNICVITFVAVVDDFLYTLNSYIYDIHEVKHSENLYYNKKSGQYYYIVGDNTKQKHLYKLLSNNRIDRIHHYETFRLDYSSNNLISKFNLTTKKEKNIYDKKQTFLKYSFGLEFETKEGIIPEHLCYSHGLIPLHDGSISGYEYSTIVLGKTYGLSLLKSQLELLKEYTQFDKECSLHIHFGKLPVNIRFAYILYRLCYAVQEDLENYVPKYAFHTSKFKKSGKDYCKILPYFENMSSFYNYFAEDSYADEKNIENIDLSSAHPLDLARNRKWNVHSRYHWINFVNLLFYNSHKTVEFRFLAPTYNFNKIVTWINIFTAIIAMAEFYYTQTIDYTQEKFYDYILQKVPYNNRIDKVCDNYWGNYAFSLDICLQDLKDEHDCQMKLHDYIGARAELDDLFCKYKFIK